MDTLGERIKLLRAVEGLTQKQLGDALKMSHQHISNVEKNKETLSDTALLLISHLYLINYEWLKYGEGTMVDKPDFSYESYQKSIKEVFKRTYKLIEEMTTRECESTYLIFVTLLDIYKVIMSLGDNARNICLSSVLETMEEISKILTTAINVCDFSTQKDKYKFLLEQRNDFGDRTKRIYCSLYELVNSIYVDNDMPPHPDVSWD